MLYKIDFTRRNDGSTGTRWMKNFADKTQAATRFMDDFFVEHPDDAVKVDRIIEVEFTGDLSNVDIVIDALAGSTHE